MDDDPRYITVDGRRWRATDPSIPQALRHELVDELMSARRAVAAANRARSDDDLVSARSRVHAAKVALGERGAPWWEQAGDDDIAQRARATISALTHHRAPDRTICPSDAARVVGGPGWRRHMDLVRHVAAEMADSGSVEILQRGEVVHGRDWRGPVRIRAVGGTCDPAGE